MKRQLLCFLMTCSVFPAFADSTSDPKEPINGDPVLAAILLTRESVTICERTEVLTCAEIPADGCEAARDKAIEKTNQKLLERVGGKKLSPAEGNFQHGFVSGYFIGAFVSETKTDYMKFRTCLINGGKAPAK